MYLLWLTYYTYRYAQTPRSFTYAFWNSSRYVHASIKRMHVQYVTLKSHTRHHSDCFEDWYNHSLIEDDLPASVAFYVSFADAVATHVKTWAQATAKQADVPPTSPPDMHVHSICTGMYICMTLCQRAGIIQLLHEVTFKNQSQVQKHVVGSQENVPGHTHPNSLPICTNPHQSIMPYVSYAVGTGE